MPQPNGMAAFGRFDVVEGNTVVNAIFRTALAAFRFFKFSLLMSFTSLSFNFYTNSKKAIKRANVVVKNSSNIFSSFSIEIPSPLSENSK